LIACRRFNPMTYPDQAGREEEFHGEGRSKAFAPGRQSFAKGPSFEIEVFDPPEDGLYSIEKKKNGGRSCRRADGRAIRSIASANDLAGISARIAGTRSIGRHFARSVESRRWSDCAMSGRNQNHSRTYSEMERLRRTAFGSNRRSHSQGKIEVEPNGGRKNEWNC